MDTEHRHELKTNELADFLARLRPDARFPSLDDLIAAEARKLDTLKTHKKGLMQQLFPVLDEVQA